MATDQKERRNSFAGTTLSSAKMEFEKRMKALPETIRQPLLNGTAHTVDLAIYVAKNLGSETTIELLNASDAIKTGVVNLNKRQLDANQYALITGIQLLEAEVEADTDDALQSAKWDVISDDVANGEFELENGNRPLFPRNSCEIFRTDKDERKGLKGYYHLECPKMLNPLTDIVPTLRVPKGLQGKKAVKLILHGVRIGKA